MADETKITILPGGPYKVSAGIPLKQAVIKTGPEGESLGWAEGKQYTVPEGQPYTLCRCGRSKNKPFCDGKHLQLGVWGAETAEKEPYLDGCQLYEGASINLYDNENLCASVRFCTVGQGVWQATLDSDVKANRALAIQQAADCAAGRLTVALKDGTLLEPDLPKEISPITDTAAGMQGPLWVKGGILLEGADGEVYEVRNRMTLCRCGESKNMPFCDITHLDCPHMQGPEEQE